jgi:hypothetical protein
MPSSLVQQPRQHIDDRFVAINLVSQMPAQGSGHAGPLPEFIAGKQRP